MHFLFCLFFFISLHGMQDSDLFVNRDTIQLYRMVDNQKEILGTFSKEQINTIPYFKDVFENSNFSPKIDVSALGLTKQNISFFTSFSPETMLDIYKRNQEVLTDLLVVGVCLDMPNEFMQYIANVFWVKGYYANIYQQMNDIAQGNNKLKSYMQLLDKKVIKPTYNNGNMYEAKEIQDKLLLQHDLVNTHPIFFDLYKGLS